MTTPAHILTSQLGKHSLMSPGEAAVIAQRIVEDLGLTTEEATPKGLEYLSAPKITRLVSEWRKA